MKRQIFGLICFCLFVIVNEPLHARNDLAEGLRAYTAQNYLKAVRLLELLAKAGEVDPQRRVGMMYDKGFGCGQRLSACDSLVPTGRESR